MIQKASKKLNPVDDFYYFPQEIGEDMVMLEEEILKAWHVIQTNSELNALGLGTGKSFLAKGRPLIMVVQHARPWHNPPAAIARLY